MCIFSQPIVSVDTTQIFARWTASRTQLLAYQMNYESQEANAMILPLPVRQPVQENHLRFIDLQGYDQFFEHLENGFPWRKGISFGCSGPRYKSAVRSVLKVFEVGNYIASFVPTLAEFSRLDTKFTLPENIWAQLPQYQNYGFAVFQLASGARKPHPMAFEFESSLDSLYFPTVHLHDGEVHATEDFDHMLYLQHAGLDSRVGAYVNADCYDRTTELIRSKQAAHTFCAIDRSQGLLQANLLVHRKSLRGPKPNKDTFIATPGHPTIPTWNLREIWNYTPWLAFAGAITWLFLRRRQKQREGS